MKPNAVRCGAVIALSVALAACGGSSGDRSNGQVSDRGTDTVGSVTLPDQPRIPTDDAPSPIEATTTAYESTYDESTHRIFGFVLDDYEGVRHFFEGDPQDFDMSGPAGLRYDFFDLSWSGWRQRGATGRGRYKACLGRDCDEGIVALRLFNPQPRTCGDEGTSYWYSRLGYSTDNDAEQIVVLPVDCVGMSSYQG